MIYHVLVPLQLTEAHLMNSESHKSGVAILGDPMQSPQYVFIKRPPPAPPTIVLSQKPGVGPINQAARAVAILNLSSNCKVKESEPARTSENITNLFCQSRFATRALCYQAGPSLTV